MFEFLYLQQEDEDEEGEDGEEEEEVVGNGTRNSADKRRQLWWKAHQRTEERNVGDPDSYNARVFLFISPVVLMR